MGDQNGASQFAIISKWWMLNIIKYLQDGAPPHYKLIYNSRLASFSYSYIPHQP